MGTRARFRTGGIAGPLTVAGAVLALGVLGGCAEGLPFGLTWVPSEITELPRPLTQAEERVVGGSNALGFELLRELVRDEPQRNHLISPLGISMALAMAMEGARGASFEELRTALRLQGVADDDVGEAYRGLFEILTGLDGRASLDHGASMWYRDGLERAPGRAARAESWSGGAIRSIDFLAPEAPATMNEWMEARTDGEVQDVVPDPLERPEEAILYLLSGLRFDAPWRSRFDPARAHEADFGLLDGTFTRAQYIEALKRFRRVDLGTEGVAAELPYAGDAFSLVVIRPRLSLDWTVQRLNGPMWDRITADLHDVIGLVRLVRFELEWSANLAGSLQALGLDTAFAECAGDFSHLLEDPRGECPPSLSAVWQKTAFDVDETGAPAAPINDTGVYGVRLDTVGPFLFAVRERLTGTILLLGVLVDPAGG